MSNNSVSKLAILNILESLIEEVTSHPTTTHINKAFVINKLIDALVEVKTLDEPTLYEWAATVSHLYNSNKNMWETVVRNQYQNDGK